MEDLDNDGQPWSQERPGQAKKGMLRLQIQTLPHVTPVFNVVAVQGGREEPGRYFLG